ncbi:MAG: hypothetical protein WAX89_03350 [Alphaproteobacteria bacterium]
MQATYTLNNAQLAALSRALTQGLSVKVKLRLRDEGVDGDNFGHKLVMSQQPAHGARREVSDTAQVVEEIPVPNEAGAVWKVYDLRTITHALWVTGNGGFERIEAKRIGNDAWEAVFTYTGEEEGRKAIYLQRLEQAGATLVRTSADDEPAPIRQSAPPKRREAPLVETGMEAAFRAAMSHRA